MHQLNTHKLGFCLTPHHNLRAIGIVLAIIGVAGLIIDLFAKERADIYYEAIIEE